MVIINEKCMIPPPPYAAAGPVAPPPFPDGRSHSGLAMLPPHLLLKIIYMTFPQAPGMDGSRLERQRKILYWLAHSLRLVNRSFYFACMHVLRSVHLPAYSSLIRAPYTSDAFPLSSSTSFPTGPAETTQRETQVLDLFIALKVREDVMMDDTELHLEREESFKDLFDLMQPRSRLEDLVRHYGLREGAVRTDSPATASSSSTSLVSQLRSSSGPSSPAIRGTNTNALAPVPFSSLSVSFSTRKVGLVLTTKNGKRTIVETTRTRDEKLEATAKKLTRQLKVWLNEA